jgi:peptide/nickel transport system substrate-binding protein
MNRSLLAGGLAFALIAGAATFGPAAAAEPKRGGTLEYGVKAEPETYDVHATNAYGVMHYVPQHYSLLLTFDWDHFPKLVGDLASDWNLSDDGLTYTFTLRDGVEFHDGTPFTSADVKATYDRLRNPPEGEVSARQALFESIDTIDTPDDRTVVFHMKTPDAFMTQNFASPYNSIYSKKDIDRPGNWHKDHINGTGPFTFVEYVAGGQWTTKRYEKYHHDDVYLDGTVAYAIKNVTTPMAGGQIMAEWRSVSPPEQATLVKQMGDKVKFVEGPWLSELLLTLNSKFPPFADKRVRQALSMCIDRVNGLKQMSKLTIVSPFASGHLLATSDWALPEAELQTLPGFSPDGAAAKAKAKALLKEAGHEGLTFVYANRATAHPFDQLAVWLISEWKQCGLNPQLVTSPVSKFVQDRSAGAFDVTIDWASNFLPDPTQMLSKYLSADRTPQNYSGYTDREVDAWFDEQRKETDPARRKELAQNIERKLIEEAWTLPLTYMSRTVPLSSKVMGYKLAPTHVLNTDWRGVWLDQ